MRARHSLLLLLLSRCDLTLILFAAATGQESRMPEPSYMMALRLRRRRPKRTSVLANIDRLLVTKVPKVPLKRPLWHAQNLLPPPSCGVVLVW